MNEFNELLEKAIPKSKIEDTFFKCEPKLVVFQAGRRFGAHADSLKLKESVTFIAESLENKVLEG